MAKTTATKKATPPSARATESLFRAVEDFVEGEIEDTDYTVEVERDWRGKYPKFVVRVVSTSRNAGIIDRKEYKNA